MKTFNIALMLGALLAVSACTSHPFSNQIEAGHSRFVNLMTFGDDSHEHVFLMCHRNRPTDWVQASTIKSGEHNLWIETNSSDFGSGLKLAVVSIAVKLEDGKRYALHKERQGNQIAIWIEDEAINKRVSEVAVGQLRHPQAYPEKERIKQCRAGTV